MTTKEKIKSYFLPRDIGYCFYKTVKIGSCTERFLLFSRNLFCIMQSIELIMLQILLECIVYLQTDYKKLMPKCSGSYST